jgi:hypothetical protein
MPVRRRVLLGVAVMLLVSPLSTPRAPPPLQVVDQRTQRPRCLPPLRIVQVVPGERRAELPEDRDELTALKWRWMSERKADSLATLFHEEAVFVHMGATMSRNQELDVIRSGAIQYKNVEIQDASVRFIGTTAILTEQDSSDSRRWGQ